MLLSLVFLLRVEQHKTQFLSDSSADEGRGYEPSVLVQRDSSGSGRAGEQKQSREQGEANLSVDYTCLDLGWA